MKLILVVLAFVGLSCASTYNLRQDIDDFLALIPKDKIREIYVKYQGDPDIQKVVAYLKSKDFAAVAHIVAGVDEVKDLVNYLESKDIHVVALLNKLADLLGLPHWPGSFMAQPYPRQNRSWRDFIDEIKAALPMEDLINLAVDKLANSPDFQELFEKISSVDYQKLHDNALKHPEIVDMITRLEAMGVDVGKIWEAIKSIFGWEYRRSTRSLKSDLDDFLALIPVDKIKTIYHKYENDPDIKKVVAYLKSKDFAAVADILVNVDEVKDMVNYLQSKGVNIIEVINKIADHLGLPHWPGSIVARSYPRQNRAWRDFLNEVVAALPVDDLVNLGIDKLANSADFQELFEKISNLDYQKLHDNALKHPEIVDMITRLEAMGVDIKKVWEAIKAIFGWE